MAALLCWQVGCASQFEDPNYHNLGVGAAGISAMFLFGAAFNSSFGPSKSQRGPSKTDRLRTVAWSYQIEIFPMNLRAKGAGVATAATWVSYPSDAKGLR